MSKIFNDNEIARIQISYLFKQPKNIRDANNLRDDLKELQTVFKDQIEDFESNYMNPKYEFNVINEIYQIPKYRNAYNEEINKGLDDLVKNNINSIGKGYNGGSIFAGTLMILLGIITIPFFMLIFPILLIVFGSRKVRDSKESDRIFIEQNMNQYGIKTVHGYKPDNIKKQFKDHIEKIKNMDDKTEYFELFTEKLQSFAKFMYKAYDYHELMSIECVKSKQNELKETVDNLKIASKQLLEISKTISKKYDESVKKIDKKLFNKSQGNYYFLGNAIIMFTDDEDVQTLEDLFYMYEHNLAQVHNATCYRNDNDVEELKNDFAVETLNVISERLLEEGIIVKNEEVYSLNKEVVLDDNDQKMMDLFLELLDTTNAITEFENIFNS